MPTAKRKLGHPCRALSVLKAIIPLTIFMASTNPLAVKAVDVPQDPLRVSVNFNAGITLRPHATLELNLSRRLLTDERNMAVFIGETDVTAFCIVNDKSVTYTPRSVPLPVGETSVIVYFVSDKNKWTEFARFPLVVEEEKPAGNNGVDGNGNTTVGSASTTAGRDHANPFKFEPSVSVNVKAQSTVLYFPDSERPQRINFTDVALQATLNNTYKSGPHSLQNQFDVAGSSVQSEALRFGQLGKDAPQIDLSSYAIQYQLHGAQMRLGQVSFGRNRQLINSFSSRGVSLTVPITSRFDVSGAMMNGTSIVGISNFFGLNQTKHQVFSGTLGVELLEKRPGGLRVELTGMRGSLLPINNFNESNVNDAEKSNGGGVRVAGSDKSQRFRFDGAFAISRFTNPSDPLLNRGQDVVPVRAVTRYARYLDLNYDVLSGYKVIESRPLTLSLSFKHEMVEPEYRSVAAFSQADRQSNQFDVTGSFGSLTFGFDHTRGNDNLQAIRSILKTLSRRTAFNVATPAIGLFKRDAEQNSKWFPVLSFTFDRVHQVAAFFPLNADFTSPSQVPDQVSTNQSFGAEWQVSSTVRFGYRFNHSFQDNRQLTRDRNDLLSVINGVTVGLNPAKSLDLSFELGTERSSAFDQNTVNTTLRIGTSLTWRMNRKMVWAMNASTTGAGDRANTNHRRDADFDIQYSWRFLQTEKDRWRKMQGQFFIRYANRYGLSRDTLFGFDTLTKLQTLNAGLNFIFF